MSTPDLHDRISQRAYHIWEQEGRPEGRQDAHWLQAESECLGALGSENKTANGHKARSSRANGTRVKKSVAADDLMQIKGLGKTIAGKLNDMGVTSLAQVAGWTAEDVKDINEKLALKGRIERGDWISQAKVLLGGH